MHGRMKIKSTAQQQAEKEAAQKKKLAAYQYASNEILSRKEAKRFDVDTLKLVATVLEKNPDVTVLWNYRRDIFNYLKESLPKEELESLFDSELDFIAICLMVNPKSYYAWHHRCWILLNSPKPDWNKELKLTAKFLCSDERNFHCWDYRRWLVKQAQVSVEKELDFVTSKLYDNFSNFSAWHYRSRLIPKIHQDGETDTSILQSEVLKEEFDMVKNALYVDPQDQSPWFYHRWLMSKCSDHKIFVHSALLNINTKTLTVVYSSDVMEDTVKQLQVRSFACVEDSNTSSALEIDWFSPHNKNASAVWFGRLPFAYDDSNSTFEITDGDNKLTVNHKNYSVQSTIDPKTFFFPNVDTETIAILESELESITELHSMEENSKWVILELTALLRILTPLDAEKDVISLVDKLANIDPLRISYYDDLKSRILIENQIIRTFQEGSSSFFMKNVGLTRLPLLEWLAAMTEIDISDNNIHSLPDDCQYLTELVTLNVSGNKLTSLLPLQGLSRLEKVLARDNRIICSSNVKDVLLCPEIKLIDLRGNGITSSSGDSDLVELCSNYPKLTVFH